MGSHVRRAHTRLRSGLRLLIPMLLMFLLGISCNFVIIMSNGGSKKQLKIASMEDVPAVTTGGGRRSLAMAALFSPGFFGEGAAAAVKKCKADEPQEAVLAKKCKTPVDFDPKVCKKKGDGETRPQCLALEEDIDIKCASERNSRDDGAYPWCVECQERLTQGLKCIRRPVDLLSYR